MSPKKNGDYIEDKRSDDIKHLVTDTSGRKNN